MSPEQAYKWMKYHGVPHSQTLSDALRSVVDKKEYDKCRDDNRRAMSNLASIQSNEDKYAQVVFENKEMVRLLESFGAVVEPRENGARVVRFPDRDPKERFGL